MRSTFKVIIICLALVCLMLTVAMRQVDDGPAKAIDGQLVCQADSLLLAVRQLQRTPVTAANQHLLQNRFRKLRLAYKKIEWAAEYFDPLTTRLLNGPPVPEAELTGQVIEPEGLQVLETELFPQLRAAKKQTIRNLLLRLELNAEEFRDFFSRADLKDWQIIDAAKLEVFRVESLGLNDFDDPLLKNCFKESAVALQGVQVAIAHYDLRIDFTPAIDCLNQHNDFNSFDRAGFIMKYANPLTENINALPAKFNLPNVKYNRLLNQNAATLFAKGAFNRNAFIASPGDSATTEKIALGKKLFFDPILSGSLTRSCATCHQPDKAFTDGLKKNLDITGKKFIARNTPTLINAALQPAQFYDLRAASLEDQANDVVRNRDEMHGDMLVATGRLWKDTVYRRLFNHAYPVADRASIDTLEVMNALASYVRSLTNLNSRFDSYMQDDRAALNRDEITGFNLFMGKAKCGTCHYMPLFNGALVPRYMQMEAEVIGVPETRKNRRVNGDPGTYGIQPLNFNKHAFKVPTLRNAGKTAPYMHNGVYQTLDEVIDFYNKGGGAGVGLKVPNQTLDPGNLQLTKREQRQLVAFIKSLDSR